MPKIVFAGVVRDCATHLPSVLGNLERLSLLFDDAAYVFVENDSADSTKQLLAAWGAARRNFHLFNLDGLGRLPHRTLRLEFARNTYFEFVRSDPLFTDFDYLCVVDMDDAGSYSVESGEFTAAMEFMRSTSQCAGVFANQAGIYYDIWAFRHAEYCPSDAWFEVLEWAQQFGTSDQEAFDQTFAKRIRSFGRDLPPIEVDSAFGGLGIYSLDYLRRCRNPYLGSRVRVMRSAAGEIMIFRTQQCEHVHMHAGLRQLGGRLFILPWLINRITGHSVTFPSSAYRSMCF